MSSTIPLKIKHLFIANRGEVCRRIASTARRMGLRTSTVAMSSAVPPACIAAVIDVFVPAAPDVDNPYLSIDEMVRCAKAAGADAVHPGFGFLSENDAFARAVTVAGLVWVGPNAGAIAAMASKSAARSLAEASGVRVNHALQGLQWQQPDMELAKVKSFAKQVGFPVLIKAAFGGGGKGMRIVYDEDKLSEALTRCHSEALASFANGELLVEKYIEAPRHVEVQVFGDQHGHAVAIGDRDCSLQRRHQKIIEEAPAPDLNDQTRVELHAAAVQLCKKVGYDNAGTVEFLVDASVDYRKGVLQPFYFLEMNTRLQVEHPVTEEVFGLDLVELQLTVACGQPLPEIDVKNPRGWSVEARIYAEDVRNQFLPSPGRVVAFEPAADTGIRWEFGIDGTDEVSAKFDPMIAKCIATGPTRLAALDRLYQTLDQTVLLGPKHNISFVQSLCKDPAFRAGAVTTHHISKRKDELIAAIDAREQPLLDRLKDFALQWPGSAEAGVLSSSVALPTADDVTTHVYGQATQQRIEGSLKSQWQIVQTKRERHRLVSQLYLDKTIVRWNIEGLWPSLYVYAVEQAAFGSEAKQLWLHCRGVSHHVIMTRKGLADFSADQGAQAGRVEAPVPGKVVTVKVAVGSAVELNQVMMVLESMKMEFEIKSGKAGSLSKILVQPGEQVSAGQTLALWND